MNYDKLDSDELLRVSLNAINTGRDAESLELLKTLLERDPGHTHARYLLAAQHAQLGIFERAEEGLRAVVAMPGALPAARFQLGQLLLTKGALDEAREVLSIVGRQADAMGAYARGLAALAGEDVQTAQRELDAGLAMPQEIPALQGDMQRLLGQLLQTDSTQPGTGADAVMDGPAAVAPAIQFTQYGKSS